MLLIAILAASTALPFDKVLLHDGRLIEGKILQEESDEDTVFVRLPGADIPIRSDLVDRTYIEDLED